MKQLILFVFLLFAGVTMGQQRIDLDARKSEPKTEQQLIGKSEKTKDIAVYQKKEYPVYRTSRGKQFILVLSRNGNLYKKYI